MASLWNKPSGTILATLQERQTITLDLPLEQVNATINLISGNLPRGMRLSSSQIIGTPFEVPRETTYTFVLRAKYNDKINDRTFNIIVQGADEPSWITQEDLLPVGVNDQYFILDSAPVDFQLEAIDSDTSTGQQLEYFIGSRDGQLPPGIQLTRDGRLVGIVDPILAIEKAASSGKYDDGPYDYYAGGGYDFSIRPSNGYDSFFYDTTIYDLSIPTKSPKKLNRFYQFTVSVSDGDTVAKRTFRIYVVGDDFFRSDTTVMQVGTGIFTADVTHVRSPIWITPRDFGFRRANNYVTLKLDVIDPSSLSGVVVYNLASKNDDGSDSILPPGLNLDSTNGEVAGYTPYQPAVTREYKFTVNARRIALDEDRVQFLTFSFEVTPKNSLQIKINKLGEYANKAIGLEFNIENIGYRINSIITVNPDYDTIILDKPTHIYLEKGYSLDLGTITVVESEIAEKAKTFVVRLLGEVDSTIKWLTLENLGNISSNYVSTLSVRAQTTVPNARLLYSLVDGRLPPGLKLNFDGEIIGKINSFGTIDNPGLTIFDGQQLQLDGNTTTVDRKYSFTVKARDQFGFSAIQKQFTITVDDPSNTLYSNIYAKPFMKENKRAEYNSLLNNSDIFLPEYIYRPNDPSFGLQREIKILIYAGIETKNLEEYVAAAAKNHSRKRFIIGEVKTAVAKNPGTNDVVYEVVYVELIDPYDSKKGEVRKTIKIKNPQKQQVNSIKYTTFVDDYDLFPNTFKISTRNDGEVDSSYDNFFNIYGRSSLIISSAIDVVFVTLRDGTSITLDVILGTPESNKYRPDPENTITVDSNAITIDGANDQVRYISNISHMRDAIRSIGDTERNYLPLWMRTPQEDNVNELGYVMAVPLVYCKPNTSKIIKNSIDFYTKNNSIDFTNFNIDIDRYIIDSAVGSSSEQYILFANYKFNI